MSAAPAIRLVPRPSRAVRRALCAGHLLAAALALVAAPGPAAATVPCAALAVHLAWTLRWCTRAAQGLLAVNYDAAGQWRLQWRDGRSEAATPCGPSIVTPWLVCLRLRAAEGGARVTLLLTDDVVDDASLRRLRARLAWQRAVARGSGAQAFPPREP